MKRIISFGIILFSAALFICSVYSGADKFIYEDYLVSQEKLAEIISTRKLTDQELLQELHFNNYDLFYDELFSRWYYSVSPDCPNLNPKFSYSSTFDNAKIAFGDRIQPGKGIPFIVYTDSLIKTYELIVTTLPLIQIESIEDIDFSKLNSNITYPVKFKLFDNSSDARFPFILSDGSIHIRGRGTATYAKKQYKITLYENKKGTDNDSTENQIPLLGLRSDGDWLLYPSYNDQERIRNVFSSKLWLESCGNENRFGIKNGNEYRYVELFFNQQYWGLYAIGYPIDAKQMGIQADQQGHYNEFLFKQSYWGPKFEQNGSNNIVIQFDASEEDIAFGIELLKVYYDRIFNETLNSLWHNDGNNAIDIWLFLTLIQANDSVNPKRRSQINNVLYTTKMSDEGRKLIYTPWDMDRSWGNAMDASSNNTTKPYALDKNDNSFIMELSPVTVLQKTGYQVNEMIKARYHELRNDKWSEQFIDALLDSFEADIYGSGAYNRDMERWPNSSYQDPESGLSVFKDFVHGRLESMDAYVDGL